LRRAPGALLNFAEGTRFSETKKATRGSSYRHLLNPRAGGLSIMLQSLPVDVIDVTIVYPADGVDFWRCLGGDLTRVELWLDRFGSGEITDAAKWLGQRWQVKDERIEHSTIRQGVTDNR